MKIHKKNAIILFMLLFVTTAITSLVLCLPYFQKATPAIKVSNFGNLVTPSPTPPQPVATTTPVTIVSPTPTPSTVRLLAVGDIIVHDQQLENGYDESTGDYDFSRYFTAVKDIVTDADFAIANLETTLAGKTRGYTGYPEFNSPEVLASVLKSAGFDFVSTANNHCLDRGFSGLSKTLDELDNAGLLHVGTYREQKESEQPMIQNIKGIRIAYLAYTYSTNGISLPSGKKYAVSRIDRKKILADIRTAKSAGCDIIVCSMHFGTEYQSSPDEDQRDLTQFLFENGVEIVLGSHPHVLQPMEIQTISIGGVQKKCFVAYSLGNFISKRRELDRASSVMLQIDLRKDASGKVDISHVSYIPTFVDMSLLSNGKHDFRVIPMEKSLETYESGADPLLTQEDADTLKICYKNTVDLMGSEYLESNGGFTP